MKLQRLFAFLFTSVTTGLAAAFLVMLIWPEFFTGGPASSRPESQPVAAPAPFSYADAVAAAAPSVVNIYTTKITKVEGRPLFKDPVFQRFFGNYYSKPTLKEEHSLGSGVVVDANGYILTNHHVIESASDIRIVADGQPPMPARVVGRDPDTDLAVVQAGGEALPAALLGDSGGLRVGDVVLAIGNPFGVGKTVTQGIIGATGRHELGLANYEDFIQTDAAINQGNSGGALINARGEVIGINTAILSRSGGSHGIGFAIPIALARQVMQQIIEHGRVIRGWIGVSGQQLTPELAESLDIEMVDGVLISGVLTGGPADNAGILPGDVLQSIDSEAVNDIRSLLNRIATVTPGTKLRLGVWRNNRNVAIPVRVAERPEEVD